MGSAFFLLSRGLHRGLSLVLITFQSWWQPVDRVRPEACPTLGAALVVTLGSTLCSCFAAPPPAPASTEPQISVSPGRFISVESYNAGPLVSGFFH